MKKFTVTVMALLMIIAMASVACARGTADVSNTVHNMSSSGPVGIYASTNEDQICVFCHTPHGGSLTGPLWNRSNVSGTWTHYNSATLSSQVKGYTNFANGTLEDESMLCMSCHDGSIAIASLLVNPVDNSNIQGPFSSPGTDWFVSGTREGGAAPGTVIGLSRADMSTGRDLSDDHPVSFSYDLVIGNPPYSSGSKVGHLRAVVDAEAYLGEGVAFFGSDNRVECSSCHDPHVDYNAEPEYDPFLIRTNSNSELCFACHIK